MANQGDVLLHDRRPRTPHGEQAVVIELDSLCLR